jgi:predicted AAA+ superfamily ATPase
MQEILINKEEYYDLLSENIILKDIYVKNNLKNYSLLKNIIIFLALNNDLFSAREIHKILNNNSIKVSHITVIEYLDYILESNLIKKIYRIDFKSGNKSSWKAKYLFCSSDIRKAILKNKIEKSIFNENMVYDTLITLWKNDISTWKNGTLYFSFVSDNLIIHISNNIDKNEVKKEAKKLLKIPWNYNKYLIVNSIKETWIRPSTYLPLKILEIEGFIKEVK